MDMTTAYTVDKCLQQKGLSLKQYITKVGNVGSPIDGLFVWLVSWCFNQHVNVVHSDGVWTTRRSVIPDLHDPTIVLMLNSYLFSPAVSRVQEKHVTHLAWPTPAELISDLVPFMCMLNSPVKDIQTHCYEMDLASCGTLETLHVLLQNLMGGPYHDDLMAWLQEYKHLFGSGAKWLTAQGLDFPDYIHHLQEGGISDRLKLWLVSLVLQ